VTPEALPGSPATPQPLRRPPVTPCAELTDVVYTLSNVTWQAAARRGFFASEDQLLRSLILSDRIGRLLICNHARSLPIKLVRDLMGSDRAPFPSDERTALIEPLRLRRLDPSSIRGVRREFATYDRTIERAVRRHGLRDPVVITGHPLVAGFAPLRWARSVTWYAIDDWSEHPAYSRWRDAYLESYKRVRERGLRVAAVSSALLKRLDPDGRGAVVPNGLEPAEWEGPAGAAGWIGDVTRPLLVYVGGLDSRLDIDWLRELARNEPSATIALIGPLIEPAHFEPLHECPNVRMVPPVGRPELTAIVRAADAGLLPHVVSRLTEAMSPLKLLEYLAAGLPVAATDLSPIREMAHPRVVRVPSNGDYAQGVRDALAIGRAPEPERLEFIAANSWRSRHNSLLDLALAA
jgi:teichuronic acid biosynthesis glycosyltransferase TuaH